MAYYNFNCTKCGEFQINIPMNNVKETTECPKCKSISHRVWDIVGIQWNCKGNFGKSSGGSNG